MPVPNDYADLLKKLAAIDQLDSDLLDKQRKLLHKLPQIVTSNVLPFNDYVPCGNEINRKIGLKALAEGKMGTLILAGGQGTRIGFDGPKGLYPISAVEHKTLFQLFAEKTVAASKLVGHPLQLAIMTSPLNHEATLAAFKEHHFYGLPSEQVSFFTQQMLPFLDEHGDLFLEDKNQIAYGPNGNGEALQLLLKSEIGQRWKKLGIEFVNVVLIDNPLADPFDSELLGFHIAQQSDVTIKCTERQDVNEKVGLVVQIDDKAAVIEYSEIDEKERTALNTDGTFRHRCANISLFCFSLKFIERVADLPLPLHKALKSCLRLNPVTLQKEKTMAWKFETYIFDLLFYANKVAALLYPRKICFAPLKNREGDSSPETVRKALLEDARRVYKEVTGKSAPAESFELPQEFYYPTPEFIAQLQYYPPITRHTSHF